MNYINGTEKLETKYKLQEKWKKHFVCLFVFLEETFSISISLTKRGQHWDQALSSAIMGTS